MKALRSSAPLLLLAISAGCALPGKISSEMQMRPNRPQAAQLRTIAILRFDSTGQRDITPEIEAALTNATFEGKPYFTIVERRRLDDALRELRLRESGALDPSTAAKLGQMIAAKGVYMGAITRDDVADQHYYETRQVCAEVRLVQDRRGVVSEGPCVRYANVNVQCTKRTANFEFVPKLVDVARGTVVYSRSIGSSATSTVCQNDQAPLPLAEDMRRQVRLEAVTLFQHDVAPYKKSISIAYLTSSEGIATPATKERFDGSIAFARANRLDRACELWSELAKAERSSASLTFNNGVCAEVAGDFETAEQLYTAADRMMARPDSTIGEGLKRVRQRRISESSRPASSTPQTSGAAPAAAPASVVQPTSARSDRLGSADNAEARGQAAHVEATKDVAIQAQAKLNAAGYPIGKPDGLVGPR